MNWLYSLSLIGYVCGFYLYLNGYSHLFYLNALCFIVAIFYVFIMTEKCNNNNITAKALSYFGKHTLDIYLFHFFVIHLTSLEMVGNWFAESGNIFLEVITGIVYSLIVAYICTIIGKVLHFSELVNNLVFGSFVNKLY